MLNTCGARHNLKSHILGCCAQGRVTVIHIIHRAHARSEKWKYVMELAYCRTIREMS